MPRIYHNSLTATLILAAFVLIAGGLLGLAVFASAEARFGAGAAYALLVPCALLWLWLTEGGWFPLTCRRFAKTDARTLTLYGAFGRIRYQCPIRTHRFHTIGGYGNINPRFLRIESPDGRLRHFPLTPCKDPDELAYSLPALDYRTELYMQRLARRQQTPAQTGFWTTIYCWGILIPAPIGLTQEIFRLFWYLHLQEAAWYWGMGLGIAAALPIAIPGWRNLRSIRLFNLPDYHYLRRTALGNALAELRYAFAIGILMLGFGAAYGWFFAHNIGWLGIVGKPFHSIDAHIRPHSKCIIPRAGGKWELSVQMPHEYRRFNGAWCSEFSEDYPPPHGIHTVYFRENRFVRELRFDAP